MSICLSVSPSVIVSVCIIRCVCKLKRYFLRLQVDKLWDKDRCNDKVNAHSLIISLKIILTNIISI